MIKTSGRVVKGIEFETRRDKTHIGSNPILIYNFMEWSKWLARQAHDL